MTPPITIKCCKCTKMKTLDAFSRGGSVASRWDRHVWCKQCTRDYCTERRRVRGAKPRKFKNRRNAPQLELLLGGAT